MVVFTFSSFSVLEKIILSGFLMFTVGPQIFAANILLFLEIKKKYSRLPLEAANRHLFFIGNLFFC